MSTIQSQNYSNFIKEYLSKTVSIKYELYFIIVFISLITILRLINEKNKAYIMSSLIVLLPVIYFALFKEYIPLWTYDILNNIFGIFILYIFWAVNISLLFINNLNIKKIFHCDPFLLFLLSIISYINKIYKKHNIRQ